MARPTDKRWKGILIDWPTIADFDTEDYELKPLNQQQVAILLALLEYQKWTTRWTGLEMNKDELETYIADIEERLMRNEAGMSIDYDALKQAIRDGIYTAGNDFAKQLVSGGTGGFTVDEDGNVVVGGDEETPIELPEDDPATAYDDSLAAQMGGTIEVTRALELFYDKLDAYYGVTNGTPTTPQPDATDLMAAYFPVDDTAFSMATVNYYAYRNTNNRLLFDVNSTMQLYMFCRGGSKTAWGKWLADQSAYPIAKFTVMIDLSNALLPEFWSSYFSSGAAKPSTQFLDASCVKVAPQTLTNLLFGVARSTTPLKSQHRMLMKVKGYALDVDGDIQDFFWYRTAAGVNTFTTPSFVHGAGANLPSQNQVVYNAAHLYEYTIDLSALNNAMVITMNKHANMNAAGLTYPVPFEITLEDLGEYAI